MKNLEGDVAVEESGQDESPVLCVPRYRGIVVQRPKWGRLALAHLEAIFFRSLFFPDSVSTLMMAMEMLSLMA